MLQNTQHNQLPQSNYQISRLIKGNRSIFARYVVMALFIFMIGLIFICLSIGAADVSIGNAINYLGAKMFGNEMVPRDRLIIETIRMPRILMGVLVGASLAVSGAVMQGLFRNPLADPGIVGVSAGAGLGAVLMIVLGGTVFQSVNEVLGQFALPIAAITGAFITTFGLYRLATSGGQTSIATLLLAGIAIAALSGAITGVLVYMADDKQLRDLTFWGLGSLAGATWLKVTTIAPIILIALAFTPFLARGLNALVLGEAGAMHLGLSIQRFKNITILLVAIATGTSVAVSGGIGFIGIVVPHMLRLSIGPDNRFLLPASAFLGASLLILCDAISRTIVAPSELPIGIITALIGAPFFLWILLRRRKFDGI